VITDLPPSAAAWTDAITRARNHIKGWSLEEKVDLATGIGWQEGACVGNTPAVKSRGWKGLCLQDSVSNIVFQPIIPADTSFLQPLGVRKTDGVTAFPAGINAAATFDRKLMRARGAAMGHEFRGKGVHVYLGPMMCVFTCIYQVPVPSDNSSVGIWRGLPTREGIGKAVARIRISQEKHHTRRLLVCRALAFRHGASLVACLIKEMLTEGYSAKHWINNEQEWARTTSSSNVDDRTVC